MKTIFEMVSQEALPLVRSLVTKQLLETGLSQKQIADRLGLTQPAISQYKNDLRGRSGAFSEHPDAMEEIKTLSRRIASGDTHIDQATMQVFDICKRVSEK